jgi:hypothetical protein
LENDVTLLSPEPSGEQTYRAILEEIINKIWQKEGVPNQVINLAQEPSELRKEIAEKDEKTKMGRMLYCFLAAALVFPKLSEPE